MKLCKIWAEQCKMAAVIEAKLGIDNALSYLVGEKFLDFLEVSETNADFRAEIPAFVDEIKFLFAPWSLAEYLEKVRVTGPFDPSIDEEKKTSEFNIRRSTAKMLLVKRAKEWLLG